MNFFKKFVIHSHIFYANMFSTSLCTVFLRALKNANIVTERTRSVALTFHGKAVRVGKSSLLNLIIITSKARQFYSKAPHR